MQKQEPGQQRMPTTSDMATIPHTATTAEGQMPQQMGVAPQCWALLGPRLFKAVARCLSDLCWPTQTITTTPCMATRPCTMTTLAQQCHHVQQQVYKWCRIWADASAKKATTPVQ